MNRLMLMSAVMVVLLAVGLCAQGVQSIDMTRSRFFVDFATFAGETDNRIEVYYKIFNDGLNYVKKGDNYIANYEINVIILGDKDRQVTGQSIDKTYILDDYALTRSHKGYLINQIDLSVKPGKYTLVCKLIDHNSGGVSSIEAKFESAAFKPGGDLSDIELIQKAAGLEEGSRFVKDGEITVPMVERAFDSEEQELGFYVEAYLAGALGRRLTLEYEIGGRDTDDFISDTIRINAESEIAPIKRFVNLDELAPSDYELKLGLRDGGEVIAEREAKFSVKWSLATLIKNDFEYAVEQLKYVISSSEKDELLNAPDSVRLQVFTDWWASKDLTPGTVENELREEYYRRIRYANQYYRAVNRQGWQTDRGMVYIRYGEPDQIERYPFELDSKPSQVWYYYAQRRTFLFEDAHGSGDYQLRYPYDGDWHKFREP